MRYEWAIHQNKRRDPIWPRNAVPKSATTSESENVVLHISSTEPCGESTHLRLGDKSPSISEGVGGCARRLAPQLSLPTAGDTISLQRGWKRDTFRFVFALTSRDLFIASDGRTKSSVTNKEASFFAQAARITSNLLFVVLRAVLRRTHKFHVMKSYNAALGWGGSGMERLAALPNSLRGQRECVTGEY